MIRVDLDLARKVLQTEAAAILAQVDRVDERFERAVRLLLDCRGRVIVTGMGKSGIICRKIAATLSSTGTSAFFLHPAEAIHGDLGAIRDTDVVLAMSHSGETEEIVRLLESIRRIGAKLIAITGNCKSTLARAVSRVLYMQGCQTVALDGDNVRHGLNADLGFSREDREENLRRVAEVAKLHPSAEKKKSALHVKANTPLRNFYKQMAEVPLTMFQLAHAKTPGSAMFFLRTAPVIAEFQRQLPAAFLAIGKGASVAG